MEMLNRRATASSVTNRAKGCRIGDLWTIFDSMIFRDEIGLNVCISGLDVAKIGLTLFFLSLFAIALLFVTLRGDCFYVIIILF